MVHEVLLDHGVQAASFIALPSISLGKWLGVGTLPDWWLSLKDHLPHFGHANVSHAEPVVGPRMVEYFAGGCPHCKNLEPIWQDASRQWRAEHHDANVAWEQKECYDSRWKEGRDFAECQRAGVESFPSIKFYASAASEGDAFDGDRSAANFVDFVGAHLGKHAAVLSDHLPGVADAQHAGGETAATGLAADAARDADEQLSAAQGGEGHEHLDKVLDAQGGAPHAALSGSGKARVVEYLSKGCPHCREFEPVWQDARKQWVASHKGDASLSWEQKECFNKTWGKGKDFVECWQDGIESYPTIKVYGGLGAEPSGAEYPGEPVAKSLLDFVQAQTSPHGAEAGHAEQHHQAAIPADGEDGKASLAVAADGTPAGAHESGQGAEELGETEHARSLGVEAAGPADGAPQHAERAERADAASIGIPEQVGQHPRARGVGQAARAAAAEEAREEGHGGGSAEASGGDAAAQAAASEGTPRVVEYLAKSCPHCKHLEPVWQDAKLRWSTERDGAIVRWEQKECFGDGWKRGRDFDECQKQDVHAFPTIKLYNGTASSGHKFEGDRTPQGLVDFVRGETSKLPGAVAHADKAVPAPPLQAASPWFVPPPPVGGTPEPAGHGSCLGRWKSAQSAESSGARLHQPPGSLALFL